MGCHWQLHLGPMASQAKLEKWAKLSFSWALLVCGKGNLPTLLWRRMGGISLLIRFTSKAFKRQQVICHHPRPLRKAACQISGDSERPPEIPDGDCHSTLQKESRRSTPESQMSAGDLLLPTREEGDGEPGILLG